MRIIRYLMLPLLCLLASYSIHATADVQPQLVQKIEEASAKKEYSYLGFLLGNSVTTIQEVEELKKTARKLKEKKLLRAIQFTLAFHKIKGRLGTDVGKLLQTAFFIETKLPRFIKKKQCYLPPKTTDLSYGIEYLKNSRETFILLDNVKSAFLGAGAAKKVFKCIRYSVKKPKLFARAEQQRNRQREWEITRVLKGLPGLFATHRQTRRHQDGSTFSTFYSKIYRPRAVIWKCRENKELLSLKEKMKIVLDGLTGLESLHTRNIIHRDLNCDNLFINIGRGKRGKRKVQAALGDFGAAMKLSETFNVMAQAYLPNNPPEALFTRTMTKTQYLSAEVFALGSVFYLLFYGEFAPWINRDHYIGAASAEEKYTKLIALINAKTQQRREVLYRKKTLHIISKAEAFELLILTMVHPDPSRRLRATLLKQQMKRIYRM